MPRLNPHTLSPEEMEARILADTPAVAALPPGRAISAEDREMLERLARLQPWNVENISHVEAFNCVARVLLAIEGGEPDGS